MSSYTKLTKHPVTGKWEQAKWLDDEMGYHHYGVRFPDGEMYDPETINLETKEWYVRKH